MRNLLLIVVDCLRADHVYQPGLAFTPTLDRLVAEGFSFTNAISHSTTTTPSFSSILTGCYPFEHGVRTHAGMKLNPGTVTLAEQLRAGGLNTYAEVCGPLGDEVGLTRGFTEYAHRNRKMTIHTDWGEKLLAKFRSGFKEPWFVLLHVWALHTRRQVLPERADRKFGATEYARALSSIDMYLEKLFGALPPETAIALTGDHGEEITRNRLDAALKKMRRKWFRSLRRRGIIKMHASHGMRDCSDGHGHGIYDVLVKVPLTFRAPGLVPHGRTGCQVRHIDIAPTLLEAAGLTPPPRMTGKGLLQIMQGGKEEHREAYMEAAGITMMNREDWLAGVRVENKYKYIAAPHNKSFQPELYDLVRDPAERRNIAKSETGIAADMAARLGAYNYEAVIGNEMSATEQKTVLARLKDLGYHD